MTNNFPFSRINNASRMRDNKIRRKIPLEKYSSGRRGAPAKGIGRETGARVQIPPSPLFFSRKYFRKKSEICIDIVSRA